MVVLTQRTVVGHMANHAKNVNIENNVDSIGHSKIYNSNKWIIDISICGHSLQAKVDTGAEVSVMTKRVFLSLGFDKVGKSQASLSGFAGHRMNVIGRRCLTIVLHDGRKVSTMFYIIDGDSDMVTLIGMPAIRELGLISEINEVKMPNSKSSLEVVAEFSKVFQGLGKLKQEVHLELKSSAVARAAPPRKVPHGVRDKLKKELTKLETQGVIARDTEPSQWLNPIVIVNKPSGDIRICLDPQYLNTQLVRSHCMLDSTTEIFARVSQSKYFTSLDANQGFHQVCLDRESSRLTCFLTPFGKYRYLRMPMGICNAPEVFHQRMGEILGNIVGVEIYIDDVLIHAPTLEKHDSLLKLVLERCAQAGITLNKDKCVVGVQHITFLGHELSAEGVHISKSKVEAVIQMVTPEDKKAVERFLGFINYLAKFVPQISEHTHSLRQVCRKGSEFFWEEPQAEAFAKIKQLIQQAPVLAYFEESRPVVLSADSSSHSIGAVLMQDGRPVEFAAKSLTECQQRYSQIEKEFLALMFACKRFKYYCWGRGKVTVETDHQPLLGLFRKDISELTPRLAAMRLEVLSYPIEIDLQYRPGKELVLADTLSRSCPPKSDCFEDLGKDPLLYVCSLVITSEQTMEKYVKATEQDEELAVVSRYIVDGWPNCRKMCASRAMAYWNFRNELSLVDGVVFYGDRLVIPVALRVEVLSALHQAHQGVTKTLQRACQTVFWPGIKRRIEEMGLACESCREKESNERREPLISVSVPDYPYQMVGIDLFSCQGRNFLMIVDYLTKWPVVKEMPNGTSSCVVIDLLSEVFSDFGTPEKIVSDNGPQLVSYEFQQFCKNSKIEHTTSSPLHPSANGQVERTIGTVKAMMKRCRQDWRTGLTAIRNTPVNEHVPSPAILLQGRTLRDKVPVSQVKYRVKEYNLELVRENLTQRQINTKYFHDSHSGPEKSTLDAGQSIHFKTAKGPWKAGKVVELCSDRSYIVKTNEGLTFRRNRKDMRESSVKQFESVPLTQHVPSVSIPIVDAPPSSEPKEKTPELVRGSAMHMEVSGGLPTPSLDPVTGIRKSGRVTRKPLWMSDYAM